jgi:hypothetical protein
VSGVGGRVWSTGWQGVWLVSRPGYQVGGGGCGALNVEQTLELPAWSPVPTTTSCTASSLTRVCLPAPLPSFP